MNLMLKRKRRSQFEKEGASKWDEKGFFQGDDIELDACVLRRNYLKSCECYKEELQNGEFI